jgi:maltose alpha-D-glucosyltransferase / alpha-amylase
MAGLIQTDVLVSRLREVLPPALPEFLVQRRWFGGKSRAIRSTQVLDVIPVPVAALQALFVLIRIEYAGGPPDNYSLPLAVAGGEAVPGDGVASLKVPSPAGPDLVLFDAVSNRQFQEFLLDTLGQELSFPGERGTARGVCTSALRALWQPGQELEPELMRAEQSNTSVVYGKRLVFKLFRRLEEGLNPDVEIGVFLAEQTSFRNVPPVAGYLEYRSRDGEATTFGLLQGFVANQGDAWQHTLRSLDEYYRRVKALGKEANVPKESALVLATREVPAETRKDIGSYLDAASLLGKRTAELHLALASAPRNRDFVPEPFDQAKLREFAGGAAEQLARNLELLRVKEASLPEPIQMQARKVLAAETSLRQRFRDLGDRSVPAVRTRIHGDYHLGQVLFTGNDFVIIDFEGEPARPLAERRRKSSPLQDVAGMLRSFDYAAHAPLVTSSAEAEGVRSLRSWASYWKTWVSAEFLRSYLATAGAAPFLPGNPTHLAALLEAYELDKVVYELGYELNNRPAWLPIPLSGLAALAAPSD